MKSIRILLASSAIAILLTGCNKENIAPTIPPAGSMVMDFEGFWNGTTKSVTLPNSNFIYAATNVWWWNVALTVQLAIPVATFMESFNHQPVWDGDSGEWVWSYSVTIGFDVYSAELRGKDGRNEVDWNMYISKTGGFSNFLWYSGTSRKDNTSGTWQLNQSPQNPTDFLKIEWNHNEDGTEDIRYVNIIPGAAENGSYIEYGKVADPVRDAYYDIFGQKENRLINIKWNSTSHAGRVKDPGHFMDPDWHCWDEYFMNVVCQ